MKVELVTTLKRRATEILGELAENQEPVLITQHGLPAAYLLDVDTYESLQARVELLEGIARGEKAIDEGRTVSHAEAKKKMSRWLS
ncbi:MAG: type II toxin-antitoxin system Phd/YefM family antitoxin [Verrucomicrobia bacterium]|nr:type II toxin-antitoxin system Phd/YefM family antitoxin [Verrucomicrobiota bacterium]